MDIDYTGVCRISVYHLCQEKRLVTEHSFPYYEGDVGECEYITAPIRTLIYRLYFQGWNKIVVLTAMALLLTNVLTVAVKMVYWFVKYGDFYRGWNVFAREMSSTLAFCSCCFCGLCRHKSNDRDYELIEQK